MSIITGNISLALRWYKEVNRLSMSELAAELGIAVSSLQSYLNGTANPRLDTIEQLAAKMNISIIEMVSGPTPEWKRAETILRAAKEFSTLTPEQQEEGIHLFLRLVALFAGAA